jgi:toxin ParE1/3/4
MGNRTSQKYYSQLADAFSLLAKNPKLGHKHSYISSSYYTYPVGSHFIIYRFTQDDIVIIAIIHMAMDIENRINKLIENTDK